MLLLLGLGLVFYDGDSYDKIIMTLMIMMIVRGGFFYAP